MAVDTKHGDWVSLRGQLAEFQHNWIALVAAHKATDAQKFELVKVFRKNVDSIVAKECQEWADGISQQGTDLLAELQAGLDKHPTSTASTKPAMTLQG